MKTAEKLSLIPILLIIVLMLTSSGASSTIGTVYIYNGFENDPTGFYPWDRGAPAGFDQNDVGPGTLEIVENSSNAYQGARYSNHSIPIGIETAYSLLLKRWYVSGQKTPLGRPMPNELPQLYVRWYVKFNALPATWADYINLFYFFYHYENPDTGYWNDYGRAGFISLAYAGDQYSLGFGNLWGAPNQGTKVSFDTNQWYCFEVWYKKGTNGEWKFWLDGNLLFSATGNVEPPENDFLNYAVNGFDIGIYGPKSNSAPTSLLMDSIVVADYRVGPDWKPPETVTVTVQVFDNETNNYVPNAFVKMDSHEGYTNDSGFIKFTGERTFSLHTLKISKPGYHTLTESVSVAHTDLNLKFHIETIATSKLKITAYAGPTEIVSTVEISNSSGIITTVETPYTLELNPGTYTLRAVYADQTLTKTVTTLEGQPISVTFQFESKSEEGFEFKLVTFIFITIAIVGATIIWKRFRI